MSYNRTHAKTPLQKLRLWWRLTFHQNRMIRKPNERPRPVLLAVGGTIS